MSCETRDALTVDTCMYASVYVYVPIYVCKTTLKRRNDNLLYTCMDVCTYVSSRCIRARNVTWRALGQIIVLLVRADGCSCGRYRCIWQFLRLSKRQIKQFSNRRIVPDIDVCHNGQIDPHLPPKKVEFGLGICHHNGQIRHNMRHGPSQGFFF